MAMESVSVSLPTPRDNSLEELRVVIKEKKQEVKKMFAELKILLEISENTATNRLDRIYTDVGEGVERKGRTVTQLEQAKNDLNSTLVGNTMNSLLQTTVQNFDDRIAKARNSACVVLKHISLRWSIEELKQSIENVCEVISSSTAETPVSTEQPNKVICSELENIRIHYSNLEEELQTLRSSNQPESPRESDESLIPPDFTRMDYSYKTSQSAEEDVRIPKKQIEQYETNTQDLESQISLLRNQLKSKETETAILKVNLNDLKKELGNTRLQLQQTQLTNSTKVQSRRDSLTGTVVNEEQAQYSQVFSKHKQQPEYTTTKLSVNGKSSQFYSLNQVDNLSDLVGELVVCKAKRKSEYVIGTLKVVIPAKLRYEKEIAGIEFIDRFGDCTGSYRGISYFKTNYNCALFISTTEVYIYYDESPK